MAPPGAGTGITFMHGLSQTRLVRIMLAAALFLGSAAQADDGATTSLVRALAGIQSVQGRFEQTILDAAGQSLQEASGDMLLARGNRFRWQTETPFEQLAVSDGTTVWVYDRDLEQVIVKPIELDSANTPALLFAGDPAKVAEAFSVRQLEANGELRSWRLKPRADDALFVELDITFDRGTPVHMRMEDALGQQTGIVFRDAVLNGDIKAGLFSFQPPPGTDVIQQGP